MFFKIYTIRLHLYEFAHINKEFNVIKQVESNHLLRKEVFYLERKRVYNSVSLSILLAPILEP